MLDTARAEAAARAEEAGDDPATVRIVEAEDVPLTQLPTGTALKARVKAVGEMTTLIQAKAS